MNCERATNANGTKRERENKREREREREREMIVVVFEPNSRCDQRQKGSHSGANKTTFRHKNLLLQIGCRHAERGTLYQHGRAQ